MRRTLDDPILHAAKEPHAMSAGALAYTGPALCGAGMANRTEREQMVLNDFTAVSCKNCLRALRAAAERSAQ